MLLMAERRPRAPSLSGRARNWERGARHGRGSRAHAVQPRQACSIPRRASARPTSSTTTAASPRRCSPTSRAGRRRSCVRPTAPRASGSSRSGARRTIPSGSRRPSRSDPTAASAAASSTSLPTLVWLANLAALELHTNQWRLPDVEHADGRRARPRPGTARRHRRLLPGRDRACARCSTRSDSWRS